MPEPTSENQTPVIAGQEINKPELTPEEQAQKANAIFKASTTLGPKGTEIISDEKFDSKTNILPLMTKALGKEKDPHIAGPMAKNIQDIKAELRGKP